MKKHTSFVLLLITVFCLQSYASTPAFPTAEGFGKWATGGRGGKVVEVTNTLDDAAGTTIGSFRWALKQHPSIPITIVFRVSGTIDLNANELRSKRNNITIAGHTAPGDGICIKGESVNFGGSFNVIVRNLRFRTGAYTNGGVEVNAASIILENGGNFIFDHCSFSWSSEENCDFSDDDDLTVQWCIFSEGLYKSVNTKGARGYGAVIAGERSTYHHNLLAHNVSRSPRFGVTTSNDKNVLIDFVNNVNYNFGSSKSCYGGENEMGPSGTEKINFVNNYYKPGPAYIGTRSAYFVNASYEVGLQGTAFTKWHLSGNYIEGSANQTLNSDNYKGLVFSEYLANVPTCTINDLKSDHHTILQPVQTESAAEAFNSVMSKVGAMPRDTVDRRIIREAKTGTVTYKGSFSAYALSGIIDKPEDAGGYPVYTTYNTITDNDHDGMDDVWETANGLNPADAEDRNKLTLDGYTALEVYLNSLVGETIALDFSTALNELKTSQNVQIKYAEDAIHMETASTIAEVTIYDSIGKAVLNRSKPMTNFLSTRNLKNGLYFVVCKTSDADLFIGKFIK